MSKRSDHINQGILFITVCVAIGFVIFFLSLPSKKEVNQASMGRSDTSYSEYNDPRGDDYVQHAQIGDSYDESDGGPQSASDLDYSKPTYNTLPDIQSVHINDASKMTVKEAFFETFGRNEKAIFDSRSLNDNDIPFPELPVSFLLQHSRLFNVPWGKILVSTGGIDHSWGGCIINDIVYFYQDSGVARSWFMDLGCVTADESDSSSISSKFSDKPVLYTEGAYGGAGEFESWFQLTQLNYNKPEKMIKIITNNFDDSYSEEHEDAKFVSVDKTGFGINCPLDGPNALVFFVRHGSKYAPADNNKYTKCSAIQ